MALKIEEQLDLIKACFDSEAFDLLEVSGSFRVTLGSGQHIYIFPETYDNTITARFETKESDPDKRASEINAVRETLASILPFVAISDFSNTQTLGSKQVYTAKLNIPSSQPAAKNKNSPVGGKQAAYLHTSEHSDPPEVVEGPPELNSSSRLVTMDELQELLGMLDPYALEQSLDWMYIDESSRVRMALRRIFKSKTDKKRLIHTLQQEARKLRAIEDLEELEIVKQVNRDIVLQPVINILRHIALKIH
ncbi:MAG: hypothetical protein U5L07_12165 [Desulfobacterales bacterium]|nr:hypothetical protein [Desulfobacterales bacterium]